MSSLIKLLLFSFCFNLAFCQKFVIEKITIKGNKKTKEAIIKRELSIKEGEFIIKSEIDSVFKLEKQKLLNRNLFNEVSFSLEATDSTKANINIDIKERWYFWPGLDVSWADRNFNEWWYTYKHDLKRLKYGVYAGHDNLTGNADRARLTYVTGFLKQYGIGYFRPYIDEAQKYGFEVLANYQTYNNIQAASFEDKFVKFEQKTQVRRQFQSLIGITKRVGFFLNQDLQLGYVNGNIIQEVAAFNPDYYKDGMTSQHYAFLNYDLKFDHRDDVNYPTKGILLTGRLSRLGIFKADNINLWNASFAATKYIRISQKLNLSTSLRTRTSVPSKQPYLQRQILGFGNRTEFVRGYEQYIVDGQSYLLSKNNLSLKILDKEVDLPIKLKQFNRIPIRIYARGSGDMGYVFNKYPEATSSKLSNKMLYGGGIGIDIVTWYSTVLQFNYYGNALGQFRFSPKTRSDF